MALRALTQGRKHRRRWLIVAACLAAAVAIATAYTLLRWANRGPDEASVGSAVERFRSSSSSTAPAPAAPLRPAAGVYTYSGEGTERLSFLSTDQPQGPTLPGTVTHEADGCWIFRIDYNTFHQQTWNWCARDGRLVERGGTTHQQFDFVAFTVDETSSVVCDPPFVMIDPEADPGGTVTTHCGGHSETTGTDMVSDGIVRFVGRESLEIDGRPVAALHYLAERTITGDQTGNERTDLWFAAADGLPLRNEREITVVSPAPSPLDSVTYTERGSWQLTTLSART